MQSNNLTIENLEAVLTSEDKAHCDNLFQKYKELQNVVSDIFIDSNRKLFNYDEAGKAGNHPFAKESDILGIYMKKVASSLEKNSRSLVTKIESYFRKKYSLHFQSLLKAHPYQVGTLLIDYDAVIANMINQVGKDFSKENPSLKSCLKVVYRQQ